MTKTGRSRTVTSSSGLPGTATRSATKPGGSLAFAGQLFGIDVKIYMRHMMETWGAKVVASPSPDTNTGRARLAAEPECSGSLGLAISEAVEDAVTSPTSTKYALGSVLNHLLLHQTVIGLESKRQLDLADVYPDVVVPVRNGPSRAGRFSAGVRAHFRMEDNAADH